MQLNISGRSVGLAAASALNDFFIREGTATCALQSQLRQLPVLSLPFAVLGIYIEAVDHTLPSSMPIAVRPQKRLVSTGIGGLQKVFELRIGNAYYQLGRDARNEAIRAALLSVAEALENEFPPSEASLLARAICETVAQMVGPVVA
jgi:hypothetical protein